MGLNRKHVILIALIVVFVMIASPLSTSYGYVNGSNGNNSAPSHHVGSANGDSSAQNVTGANLSLYKNGLTLLNQLNSGLQLLHKYSSPPKSSLPSTSYTVTFNAINQPSGVSWSLNIYNSLGGSIPDIPEEVFLFHTLSFQVFSQSTTGSSITASLPTGTYYYYFGPSTTLIGPNEIVVTGSESVTLSFPSFYVSTVTESGLNAGTSWEYIAGSTHGSSQMSLVLASRASSSMSIYTPVGIYSTYFGVGSTLIEGHQFQVSGAGVNLQVQFPNLVPITFNEKGLNPGYRWETFTYGLTGTSLAFSLNLTTSSSTTVLLPSGRYFYEANFEGISIYNASSVMWVSTSPLSLTFSFPSLYPVTFSETGVPGVEYWNVAITGAVTGGVFSYGNESTSSTMTIEVPVGNYSYFAGISGTEFLSGKLTEKGALMSVGIAFPSVYEVSVSESGLFSGMEWTLTVSNSTGFYVFSNTSLTTSGFTFYLPNGDYTVSYIEAQVPPLILGVGSSDTVSSPYDLYKLNVTGTSLSYGIGFPSLTEAVIGVSSGILPYQSWGISAYTIISNYSAQFGETYTNTSSPSAGSPRLIAYLMNDSYQYTELVGNTQINNNSFVFNENGLFQVVGLNFPTTFNVTFSVANLPVNTVWQLDIYSSTYTVSYFNSTDSNTMLSQLPNGSYTYILFLSSGATLTSTFTVSGSSFAISIPLSSVYRVEFIETGLLAGTVWQVDLNNSYFFSQNSTLTVFEFNGTYQFYVYATNYNSNVSSGSVVVNGKSVTVYLQFTYVGLSYTVVFTETGLASGTIWSVKLGNQTSSAAISLISFSELNGTYAYTVLPVSGYTSTNTTGIVKVQGSSVFINIVFTLVGHAEFNLNFSETGLPAGYQWNATINETIMINGTPNIIFNSTTTTTSSASFIVPNGTFYFSVSANNYFASPSSGQTTVNGTNDYVPIHFYSSQQVPYTVAFTETGLPSGTLWSVTLNGTTESSTSSAISFSIPNGTYSYSIAKVSGYTVSPSSGTINVNGKNVNQSVAFTPVSHITPEYNVTFTETGLPSGTLWSINLGGSLKSSTTASIAFTEPNGTFSYTVANVTGYTSSPSQGVVDVSGSSITVDIQFSAAVSHVFLTGTISPANATLFINGQQIQTVNGNFNVSVAVGQTVTIEIVAPGYKTYWDNVTISSTATHLAPLDLKLTKTQPSSSFPWIYVAVAVVIIIVVAGLAILSMRGRARKTPPPPRSQ